MRSVLDRAAAESHPEEIAVVDDAVLLVREHRECDITWRIQSMYFMHSIVHPVRIAGPDAPQGAPV